MAGRMVFEVIQTSGSPIENLVRALNQLLGEETVSHSVPEKGLHRLEVPNPTQSRRYAAESTINESGFIILRGEFSVK